MSQCTNPTSIWIWKNLQTALADLWCLKHDATWISRLKWRETWINMNSGTMRSLSASIDSHTCAYAVRKWIANSQHMHISWACHPFQFNSCLRRMQLISQCYSCANQCKTKDNENAISSASNITWNSDLWILFKKIYLKLKWIEWTKQIIFENELQCHNNMPHRVYAIP